MNARREAETTRTLIAIDQELLYDLKATLKEVKAQLELARKKPSDEDKLLNEAEACEYLRRDADTLAYYRNNGLESYKRGRDRWYKKGDIDRWLAEGKVNRRLNL